VFVIINYMRFEYMARNLKCRNPINALVEYPYSSEIIKFEYYIASIYS